MNRGRLDDKSGTVDRNPRVRSVRENSITLTYPDPRVPMGAVGAFSMHIAPVRDDVTTIQVMSCVE
ncbi:hypothetical protein RvY_00706 [Ramazzottius varieornatus]|uniref:Uncharacterized protein n=1 Tax=Ramazzottius varieornatus TaxID=947166 RepID=A0A1D1UHC4_RAMVA|nr:hypothetical protein RvY_00706 [Ramazzottius varieornatus]